MGLGNTSRHHIPLARRIVCVLSGGGRRTSHSARAVSEPVEDARRADRAEFVVGDGGGGDTPALRGPDVDWTAAETWTAAATADNNDDKKGDEADGKGREGGAVRAAGGSGAAGASCRFSSGHCLKSSLVRSL